MIKHEEAIVETLKGTVEFIGQSTARVLTGKLITAKAPFILLPFVKSPHEPVEYILYTTHTQALNLNTFLLNEEF